MTDTTGSTALPGEVFPRYEPPITPGQEEWERWFATFNDRDYSTETVQRMRVLRAVYHADAWGHLIDDVSEQTRCCAGRMTEVKRLHQRFEECYSAWQAWRKVAEELAK